MFFVNLELDQNLVKDVPVVCIILIIKTLFICIYYLEYKKHLTGVRKTMTKLAVGPIVITNLLMRFNSLH